MAGIKYPDQDKRHAFPFTHHVLKTDCVIFLTIYRREDTPSFLGLLGKMLDEHPFDFNILYIILSYLKVKGMIFNTNGSICK